MKVIVNAEPFIGESRISDELGREYAERFKEEAKVKILIAQLASLGFTRFLCPYNLSLIRIFQALKKEIDFAVYPLVLDASKRSRELQDYGMLGMTKRQISVLTPKAVPKLAITLLKHFPGIDRKDFKYLSLALATLEFAAFSSLKPRIVFLHEQIVDLAIANKNLPFFRLFSSLLCSYGSDLGLTTNNKLDLFQELAEQGINARYVISPVNADTQDMGQVEEDNAPWRRKVVGKVNILMPKTHSSGSRKQAARSSDQVLEADTLLIEIADISEGLDWKQ